MKRISPNTVELTSIEMKASDLFDRRLDAGDGIDQAIERVRSTYWMYDLSDHFYAWLRFPS